MSVGLRVPAMEPQIQVVDSRRLPAPFLLSLLASLKSSLCGVMILQRRCEEQQTRWRGWGPFHTGVSFLFGPLFWRVVSYIKEPTILGIPYLRQAQGLSQKVPHNHPKRRPSKKAQACMFNPRSSWPECTTTTPRTPRTFWWKARPS